MADSEVAAGVALVLEGHALAVLVARRPAGASHAVAGSAVFVLEEALIFVMDRCQRRATSVNSSYRHREASRAAGIRVHIDGV